MIPQTIRRIDGHRPAPAVNREEWLTNVAVLLRPWFEHRGYEIPEKVRIGVGSMTKVKRTLGVCWNRKDPQGFKQIVITPFLDDPVEVAATLVHELIHALLPETEGHGKAFRAAATALGLEGRMTATVAGDALRTQLQHIVKRVGPYPHAAISLSEGPSLPGNPKPPIDGGDDEPDGPISEPGPMARDSWKFFCPGCKSIISFSAKPKTIARQPDLLTLSVPCSNDECDHLGVAMEVQAA